MPTINDKKLIDKIIALDGQYEDDPPVNFITKYKNSFNGQETYGVSYREINEYTESEYVIDPIIIFKRVINA